MSVAIVTGASRGLGEAISTGLAQQGWSLVIDGRDAGALEDAAVRLAQVKGSDATVRPWPATSPTPGTAGPWSMPRPALGGLDLLVNNASTLGASPLPPLAGYPLEALRARLRGQRVAPLASSRRPSRCSRPHADPGVINVTSDASVEHYEGWGGYGAAKAALDHLGATLAVEEPGPPGLGGRPRRHADRRCTRTRSRARTSRTALSPSSAVPALLALIEGDRPERPVPGRRARRGPSVGHECPVDTAPAPRLDARPAAALDFALPPELEAPSPPEARGMTRDAVRMMVAHKGDRSIEHTTFSELPRFLDEGDLVVVNTSGTLAAELDGDDPDGRPLQVHLSTQLPAGLWTVELRRDGAARLRAARRGRARPGRRRPRRPARRPTRPVPMASACGCGWRRCRHRPGRSTPTWPVTGARSATATCTGAGPIATYQNVYATEPGSAEMPSAGRPVHPRGPDPARRPRRRRGAVAPPHRRGLARGLRAALPRALPGVRRPPRTGSTTPAATGGRVIAVGTTVVRALESVVDERGRVHAGEGGPRRWSRPSAWCARSTAC